jgi:hypothetical protein
MDDGPSGLKWYEAPLIYLMDILGQAPKYLAKSWLVISR